MSIERIAALLAKAERTDIEAEADAYLMKAQQLATLASIDLAVARAQTARREARQEPQARTTTIGEKGRRANKHMVSLFIAIAHSNDCKVDIAYNSTYVIGYGMPTDLDVVETMFTSLAVQMVDASQRYLVLGTWKNETYLAVTGRPRRRVRRSHTAQTARAAFYQAFVARIDERLQEARELAVAEADAQARSQHQGSSGNALVLRNKDREIRAFHKKASSARGTWSGYSGGVRGNAGSATSAGRHAASNARLKDSPGIAGKGVLEG